MTGGGPRRLRSSFASVAFFVGVPPALAQNDTLDVLQRAMVRLAALPDLRATPLSLVPSR